ncbi:hypothetical protein HT102_07760 [Hoyosella sp. G463]|uniref:Uncharacterized protein n=1 Tax=Lolliginicoccus lacisalsi TaxID=2742202 RepID=A0A927PKT4_9ACTN|nr:hypothetical protein [Lolliginicoccus lacisalsi]MBD8506375.1 hypothetical protein [Lolliginicoccus lacisalsi]
MRRSPALMCWGKSTKATVLPAVMACWCALRLRALIRAIASAMALLLEVTESPARGAG